jgi:hypothetical protein
LLKAVTEVTNEINDTMIRDFWKRNNPLKQIAQASEFCVPGINANYWSAPRSKRCAGQVTEKIDQISRKK